jgi:hypothetical protein
MSRVSVADLPSFTQNLMQTHCLILPSIADKTKQEVKKKHSCKNNACYQQQACRSITLASFLIFFFMKAVTTIIIRKLSNRTSYTYGSYKFLGYYQQTSWCH